MTEGSTLFGRYVRRPDDRTLRAALADWLAEQDSDLTVRASFRKPAPRAVTLSLEFRPGGRVGVRVAHWGRSRAWAVETLSFEFAFWDAAAVRDFLLGVRLPGVTRPARRSGSG